MVAKATSSRPAAVPPKPTMARSRSPQIKALVKEKAMPKAAARPKAVAKPKAEAKASQPKEMPKKAAKAKTQPPLRNPRAELRSPASSSSRQAPATATGSRGSVTGDEEEVYCFSYNSSSLMVSPGS